MQIKKVEFAQINHLLDHGGAPPIVKDYSSYFSKFNLKKVLVVTDEEVITDIRVINQLKALKQFTQDITVIELKPDNDYSDSDKLKIFSNLRKQMWKNIFLLPWFIIQVLTHNPRLQIRSKAKQGILNDHSYLLMKKISTKQYTCVICNNLISTSSVDMHDGIDYIYDIHELEVFRNRNTTSVERSFYVFLKERSEIYKRKNIITISSFVARTLSNMYFYNCKDIYCIYNRNFEKKRISNTEVTLSSVLLIYIGNVAVDRGLEDIAKLSFRYPVLVIACNYKTEAIDYLKRYSYSANLTIYEGMDYQDLLYRKIEEYKFSYFLILINPTNPSYKYALPNKFFQAQALGIPIIAYDNTYLASIISKYKCGIIWHRKAEAEPLIIENDSEYKKMVKCMFSKINDAILVTEI